MGGLETDGPEVDPALVRHWRQAEASFFADAFAEPGMYETSVSLVRGLADGLRDLDSEAQLEDAYSSRGEEWAEARLAHIDVPRGDWLDLSTARDAAFNLRFSQLHAERMARMVAARLAIAREAGETWLVAADGSVGFPPWRTYRRVEIHTRAGLALYGYTTRDWDRGEAYWFEVLRVDPETGAQLQGVPPLRPPRKHRDRQALDRAFARARRRFVEGP